MISGTSADGIDVALVEFSDRPRLVAALTHPFAESLRSSILELGQAGRLISLDEFGTIDQRIGVAFAEAAIALLQHANLTPDAVAAIGSHGQTLRHQPRGPTPYSLQVGDPNIIAERLGRPVVADFRRRDIAAGGEGAPLAPTFHAALLRSGHESRAVLNIGGISNLSLLPTDGPVRGFDTGPGNGLLDAWAQRQLGTPFDAGGSFAASGAVDAALLAALLSDPFFQLPPPKSSGRDYFNLEWLGAQLAGAEPSPEDVQATLLELSARTIIHALRREQPLTQRLLVCGGGVHNPILVNRLRELAAPTIVEDTEAFGLNADFMEAMLFAWLARETLAGRAGNMPSVTGTSGPRVLGAIYSG